MPDTKLCAVCWRQMPAAAVEKQEIPARGSARQGSTWWQCRDRDECAAETWRRTEVERRATSWADRVPLEEIARETLARAAERRHPPRLFGAKENN